jgi:phage terminase large subunit-like protein
MSVESFMSKDKFDPYRLSPRKLRELNKVLTDLKKDQKDNQLDYMEWEKYPEQNEMVEACIHRVKTKEGPTIFVIFGGNRAGKTEAGAGVVAKLFKDMPDCRMWCATLSDLSIKVQQRKLSSLIRQRDIEYGEYNPIRGWKNNLVLSKKAGMINFKTYEQGREAFQGDDLDLIWLDEECPFDIYQECIARITDRQGAILLTFTALSGYTRLVSDLWGTDREDVKTALLTIAKNPFLPEAAKQQFMDLVSDDDRETRIEGKPHVKEGLIYKEFKAVHQIPRFDYMELVRKQPHRWQLSEGIDPHTRTPHHWSRFLYDTVEDTIYIVEELKAPYESMVIEDYAEMIHGMRRGIDPEYTQIDTSSMTPSVIQKHPDEEQQNIATIRTEFAKHGIATILCTKDNATGISLVKHRLRNFHRSEDKVVPKPKLYVFNDLKGHIFEFTHYSWDSYQSSKIIERKEMVNKPKKKDDHFMDILKYEVIKRNIASPITFQETHQELYGSTGY